MTRIGIRPELEGVVVIESAGDTAWDTWDDAVQRLDGIVGEHEPRPPVAFQEFGGTLEP